MSLISKFSTIGVLNRDDSELRVKKSFLVFLAVFMSGGGILWGSIAIFHGLLLESLIPYGYVFISLLNISAFAFTKNFKIARFVQIFISLLLPFLFQWSLGGFYSSGLIMLWAILALVASPSFQSPQSSTVWLVFFIVLTVGSAYFDDTFVHGKPTILEEKSVLFLAINAGVISTIVYGLVIFYVSRNNTAQEKVKVTSAKLKKLYVDIKRKNDALETANKDLETMKSKLQEITKKQIAINESLLKNKGMID